MKKVSIIMISMLMISHICKSQELAITLKSGKVISTEYSASSNSKLYTKDGNYAYYDIDHVEYVNRADKYATIYKLIDQRMSNPVPTVKADVLAIQPDEVMTITVKGFRKYENQRTAGKALQLAGGLLLGYSIYKPISDGEALKDDPNRDIKPLSSAIPLIGMGLLGVGIIVDINASGSLRLK